MATNFPGSLDGYVNPVGSDGLASGAGGVSHANMHANLHDAVEAIEAKVGANSSAVTSSHDYKISQLESGLSTAESEIDTLQSEMTTAQSDISTAQSDITALQGTDFTVTFGTGSDLDGSFTVTNLGSVTNTTVSVRDDSHNHVISNVDGLQAALNDKLNSSAYTANDVLTKITTVDGSGSGLDADLLDGNHASAFSLAHSHPYLSSTGTAVNSDKLDNLDSTQFLRSDAADTGTGTITISKNSGATWSNAQFVADGGSGTASVALRSYTSNIVQLRAGANPITSRNMLYIRDSGDLNDQDLKVADLVAGGNIYYAGATLAHSSRKVKENIEDYDGATSVIEQLRPVTFQFIDGNGSTQIGLIAEEVQEVLPSAVDDISDVLSLNQNSLLGLALAGLKEANTRIAVLEARVAELGG